MSSRNRDYRRSRSRSRSRDRDRRRDRSRSRDREPREGDRDRERHRERRRTRSPRERHHEERRQPRLDDRGPPRREPSPRPAPPPPLQDTPPQPRSIHKGTVVNVRAFGVFVAIPGYRKHVLVHHSQISDEIRFTKDDDDETKVKAMEFFLPKGAPAFVKITEVVPDPRGDVKVNGSLRVVDQETGEDLDPENKKMHAGGAGPSGPLSDVPPEVGTIHRAVVKRIEPYGIFVSMDGYRKFGLVHSSQVSNYLSFSREDTDEQKKSELSGVVTVGEAVFVKVVEIIEDDGSGRGPKIQCSMKLVDQKSGEDLDPMNSRYKPRGMGELRPGGPGGIGGHVGEVVGGKIDWGHMAGDVKLYVGDQGAQYKMLDDPDRGKLPGPPQLPPGNILTSTGRPLELTANQGQHGGGPMMSILLPDAPLPPPPKITSVEEALAIIEQATRQGKKKKDKKDKKKKGDKKSKAKKKKDKMKKDKKRSSSDSSTSSSSDGSRR